MKAGKTRTFAYDFLRREETEGENKGWLNCDTYWRHNQRILTRAIDDISDYLYSGPRRNPISFHVTPSVKTKFSVQEGLQSRVDLRFYSLGEDGGEKRKIMRGSLSYGLDHGALPGLQSQLLDDCTYTHLTYRRATFKATGLPEEVLAIESVVNGILKKHNPHHIYSLS